MRESGKKRDGRHVSVDDRRQQVLQAIDTIARVGGYGANYRDLGASLRLSTSYIRTLMLDHQRAGFAEPIAGVPRRGWRLTDTGRAQLNAR